MEGLLLLLLLPAGWCWLLLLLMLPAGCCCLVLAAVACWLVAADCCCLHIQCQDMGPSIILGPSLPPPSLLPLRGCGASTTARRLRGWRLPSSPGGRGAPQCQQEAVGS